MEFSQSFPLNTLAPARARAALAPLASRLTEDVMDAIRLAVSELVTNTLQHSGRAEGTPIELHVTYALGRVRIEVPEPGFDALAHAQDPDSESGRGLYIVDQVADRWGQVPDDGLWAEFSVSKPS
jgi:anti-sigma regulatory factor (Ser/Thr protein kinase)